MPLLTIRTLGVLAALAMAVSLLVVAPQPALADVTAARVDGEDRYDTAAIIAETTFDADANSFALVARADDFPDALAGAGAAGAVGAPILLVDQNEVPDRTAEALENLTIEQVIILGGETAVSPVVEAERATGYEVQRLGGLNRYATAAEIAEFLDDTAGVGPVFGEPGAILVSGDGFADTLTAGPLAHSGNLPILLTERNRVPEETDQALDDLGIGHVIILGGPAAVSWNVSEALEERGIEVTRFSGERRTHTAALFADALVDSWGFSPSATMIARGDDFPDALAAGPRGGVIESPILLTASPSNLSVETRDWLRDACPDVDAVQAIGGRQVITADALSAAVDLAEACLDPDVVASFQTELLGNPDRTHNIHLAADYVHGDVIAPDQSYSLNANIGPRTSARGFRNVENGCIGADGQPVDCVGGGVSQFITTFMNTAWRTGVDIPEFHPHSIYFRRYPVCHEATISGNTLDLVVRNNSPHDITIDTFYDSNIIGVRFLSQPWADVSWWSDPTPETAPDGPFTSSCGRTITYPDGTSNQEYYEHYYEDTGF
jgi:putative cell wall-binding protein